MKNAKYQKRQEGSATVFEVTPGVPGKGCSMILLGVLCFMVAFSLFAGYASTSKRMSMATFFIAACGIVFLYVKFGDLRPKAHRKARTFRVTVDAVDTNGMTFKNADIHRLIIKNPLSFGDEPVVITTTIGPPNLGAGIGTMIRARNALITHSLDLEAGGKAYTLAGGMDQTTAFGLLSDVAKILGRQVQ
jgi:hypothetical protein